MNEHIIPLTKRSPERAFEIRSMGGRTPSPKRSQSAKWRFLKERMRRGGSTEADIAYFLARMEDRDLCMADFAKQVEDLRNNIHPNQRLAWVGAMGGALKLVHGEKIRTENVNVNINTSIEEWERRLHAN